MPVVQVDAVVVSSGTINHAIIHLEDKTHLMQGADGGSKQVSTGVSVVGALDVIFHINAFFGTDWELVVVVNGAEKDRFTGTTDTKNKSLFVASVPV